MLKARDGASLLQSLAGEAIMRNSSITQLIIGTAVAVWNVSVGHQRGCTAAESSRPSAHPQEALLTNRYSYPSSETDFRLSDRQQLKSYFDGQFVRSRPHRGHEQA